MAESSDKPETFMHILIIGAAGMLGSRLASILIENGTLRGTAISRITLADIVAAEAPTSASIAIASIACDLQHASSGQKSSRSCSPAGTRS